MGGKEKRISLGVYPDVGMKEARERRDAARKLLAQGTHPGEHRKATKAEQAAAEINSFEAVARLWHIKVSADLVNRYADKIIGSLEIDVFPTLGHRPVGEIKPTETLAMLWKIEARGALETLKRVRQRCSDVFTYVIACGLREAENPP